MTQTVLNKWSDFRVELDRRAAQIADLRALNAELVSVLDELLPYGRAAIGLPENAWPSDNVILKARAVIAKAKGEA